MTYLSQIAAVYPSAAAEQHATEQQRQWQTHHRWADVVFTDRHQVRPVRPAGDVDNGAGEAGVAGDVFSHTR